MAFDEEKKKYLAELKSGKTDRSKKGFIDKEIVSLVDRINSKPNYYTTSSCAGRVMLITKRQKKHQSEWPYTSHEKGNYKKIIQILKEYKTKDDMWFKQESLILHVVARTIDDANKLLSIANSVGFKHSGILSTSKRIVIEIAGIERIDTIVAKGGKILVSDDYLKTLVLEANKKMEKNKDRIDRFSDSFDNI